jgi:hypothetical protein
LGALRPEQILKILELTDSFSLHREAVFIPLTTDEKGDVRLLPDGRLRIICPSTMPFDKWLEDLRSRLEKMDLSIVGRN